MAKNFKIELSTAAKRSKLPIRVSNPYWERIGAHGSGLALGFWKGQNRESWIAKVVLENGKKTENLGPVDDEMGSARNALNYDDALRAAVRVGSRLRAALGHPDALTLQMVLDDYLRELERDGGSVKDARARFNHLPAEWFGRELSSIGENEWRAWRDDLAGNMAKSSANRVMVPVKASLRIVASKHKSEFPDALIRSHALKSYSNAQKARPLTLLDTPDIKRLLEEARAHDEDFFYLCLIAAFTGARYSQIAAVTVGDVNFHDRVLSIPASAKGRDRSKKGSRIAVPVGDDLLDALRHITNGRTGVETLLTRTAKQPGRTWRAEWRHSDQQRPMHTVSTRALGKPAEFTVFRHSFIVGRLRAGIPSHSVAKFCDTSADMIDRHYAAHINNFMVDAYRQAAPELIDDGVKVSSFAVVN